MVVGQATSKLKLTVLTLNSTFIFETVISETEEHTVLSEP